MQNVRFNFTAALMCLVLLLGILVQDATRIKPADVEPYHLRAKQAIDSIPTQIGSWSAKPEKIPTEAIRLLRPNAIRCWKYSDNDTTQPRWYERWASLLVDQCKDARDMNGHWPPNCYVNSGEEEIYDSPRDWKIGDLTITGREYHFLSTSATESHRTAVYNFLIVPGRGISRDIGEVRQAAEDYQQRYYGAAQFQVLMDADLPQEERDEIFTTLMKPCAGVIKTLMSGGV